MHPHLVLEMLVTDHQRDMLAEGTRQRVVPARLGRKRDCWKPIARHCATWYLRLRAASKTGTARWQSSTARTKKQESDHDRHYSEQRSPIADCGGGTRSHRRSWVHLPAPAPSAVEHNRRASLSAKWKSFAVLRAARLPTE